MSLPPRAYTPEEVVANMNAGPTLEERVAALEQALAIPSLAFPGQWTDEQVARFREEFHRLSELPGVRWLPPAPVLTPETARALLRECVTVVQPGETLVIRAPETWTPQQAQKYQDHADAATADGRIPFKALVVIGDELSIVQPGPEAPARLPGMPTHAVVDIEWTQAGDPVSQKFGPWLIAPDDSHMAAISGFIQGWSHGGGIDPTRVTLSVGDESVAEGATGPYRDQPPPQPWPPSRNVT